jgi:hypothetical protein
MHSQTDEECINLYKDLKFKKTNRSIAYKVQNEKVVGVYRCR